MPDFSKATTTFWVESQLPCAVTGVSTEPTVPLVLVIVAFACMFLVYQLGFKMGQHYQSTATCAVERVK